MDYDTTWGVMSDLEDSFNRIKTVEDLVRDLQEAVSSNNMEDVRMVSSALSSYLPNFISQYDKASKRAWNKTVRELKREFNDSLNYDEIKKELTNESYTPFHHSV